VCDVREVLALALEPASAADSAPIAA